MEFITKLSGDLYRSSARTELIEKNVYIFGSRRYTQTVWSIFAEIHSRYTPRFIDALFGVIRISG